MTVRSILFLAFPGVGEQDLFAAWELLRNLSSNLKEQGQVIQVDLGSFEGGQITTHMGAQIATRKIASSERFDLLYVPGGIGAGAASKSESIRAFVRAHHAEGRWVAANCAGLSILHRAGVLVGTEVTAPATVSRRLAELGTKVSEPRVAWRIDPERKLVTVGGAATVHPSTIALAWHLFGPAAGESLAVAWDSKPLHGDALFSLVGPVMTDDPDTRSTLQDAYELVLLPD
jgi:putative intracellular protease/amidase